MPLKSKFVPAPPPQKKNPKLAMIALGKHGK